MFIYSGVCSFGNEDSTSKPSQHAHFLHMQMRRPAEQGDRDGSAFRYLVLRSGRIILWWSIAEYMIHVMYMHSIQSNETYLEILHPWALGKSLYCTCWLSCIL